MQKVIYTTNAVGAVHRQFRKLTSTKGGFANENSLLKLLYAGIMRATERWTHPVQHWNLTLSQMAIHFGDRISHHVNLRPWLTQSFEHIHQSALFSTSAPFKRESKSFDLTFKLRDLFFKPKVFLKKFFILINELFVLFEQF